MWLIMGSSRWSAHVRRHNILKRFNIDRVYRKLCGTAIRPVWRHKSTQNRTHRNLALEVPGYVASVATNISAGLPANAIDVDVEILKPRINVGKKQLHSYLEEDDPRMLVPSRSATAGTTRPGARLTRWLFRTMPATRACSSDRLFCCSTHLRPVHTSARRAMFAEHARRACSASNMLGEHARRGFILFLMSRRACSASMLGKVLAEHSWEQI